MKNILKLLSLIVVFSFVACEDSNNTIDQVLDGNETGAILRTIEVVNATLNSSEPDSQFEVTVEEQDEQDGGLLQSVSIYVTLRDLSPDNGTAVADDIFVKDIPASEFSPGPVGLPRATLTATYGEAQGAMGIPASDISPGDLFVFELRLNLTDGRVFGADSAAGIITGGFFSSPFVYNALILCSPQPGVYTVDMHDTFGDGWQTDDGNGGSGITVDIDGVITEIGMCSPYGGSNVGTFSDESLGLCTGPASLTFFDATATVEVPVGASTAIWSFPGDRYGEISFEVYGPGMEELYVGGIGETPPGLLPITLCL